MEKEYPFPEPVPLATQLALLPFLSAMHGMLWPEDPRLRFTIHRTVTRENRQYLQQACNYVGPQIAAERRGVGRIMEEQDFLRDLQQALANDGDDRDVSLSARSWLAVPFLGANDE